MKERALLRTGATCTCVSAVCCFTPVLVVVLGALGLSAVVGWLDYVLIPALVISAAVTAYAAVRMMRKRRNAPVPVDDHLS